MRSFWTPEEDRKLLEVYDNLARTEKTKRTRGGIVKSGELQKLYAAFPNKTGTSLISRVRLLKKGPVASIEELRSGRSAFRVWTAEEDQRLMEAYKILPKRSNGALRKDGLTKLQALFPDRNGEAIYSRIYRLKNPQPKKVRPNYKEWSEEEVARLKEVYGQDKYHLGLKNIFPDRHLRNIVAKAVQLGLSRKRLSIIPFKLSSEEAAFAAGMICGDGYVTVGSNNGKRNFSAILGYVNTEREQIDWFVKRIPRGNVVADDQRRLDHGIPHRLICYRWSLSDKPTLCLFLEQIYPYLIGVKKERAGKILENLRPVIANDIAESYLKAS